MLESEISNLIAERASKNLESSDIYKVNIENLALVSSEGYTKYLSKELDKIFEELNNTPIGHLWTLGGFIYIYDKKGLDWLLSVCKSINGKFSFSSNHFQGMLDNFFSLYQKKIEIENLLQKKPVHNKKALIDKLKPFGFFELPKIAASNNVENIINLLSSNKVPYQIAMLDFLGFFQHIKNNYAKNKTVEQTNKIISEILDASSDAVKKNFLTLNLLGQLDENFKKRYTAHKYQTQVKNDYNQIQN